MFRRPWLALAMFVALMSSARAGDHWAFQPMRNPAVPNIDRHPKSSPIDRFISHRLELNGLKHSPPADPVTLIRRAYLDLTGLPPTPSDITAFEKDETSYAELVNRLLDSPHYGERWAQHWLDVVRYADTHGFEVNTPRNNAWPYRDYVIRAFNEDKPYDRFIIDQLAGDSAGQPAGTGFLVAAAVLLPGQIGKDEESKRLARQDSLDEIIVGTCDTFLGITVGCARCHDHKFDPISQQDYYAMQAFFAGVEYGERDIETAETKSMRAAADKLQPQIADIEHRLRKHEPQTFHGRTLVIDDEDESQTTHLKEKAGHGDNPKGDKRGYLSDPGNSARLPNMSGGRYTWWRHQPGENVFTYNPDTAGKFRIWISWGAHGSGVHTRDARYVLDRDGDLKTTGDQKEIAKVDQYHFSGVSKGETEKRPLWSGLFDAGEHSLEKSTRIVLRGGDTGTGVTADVIVLQETSNDTKSLPHLRNTTNWKLNVERFKPVKAKYVRFTWQATQDNNRRDGCIDELEVFSALTNTVNLARPQYGTKATALRSAESSRHKLIHINDGRYGNEYSFINAERIGGWVQLEFAEPQTIDRITWARDRTGKYKDRLADAYEISAGLTTNQFQVVASHRDRLPRGTPAGSLRHSLPADELELVKALEKERDQLTAERTRLRKPNLIYAGKFKKSSDQTFVLRRGDPEQPTDRINARVPKALGELGLKLEHPEQDRRITLAKWIASPTNPLTARVMVNRIWQFHFGTGLVSTSSDFGRNGAKPSHPDLLDWLATEFIRGGWSIKHLHRLIMLSDTYRQASRMNDKGRDLDADSRLLWRFPPRRLEAEAIRDSILFVSGSLNLEAGGPGFSFFKSRGGLSGFPPVTEFTKKEYRRMIYQHKIRMERVPVFGAFDAPDAGQAMPRRKQSTTAIQALNLFNSPFVNDQAAVLTERIKQEAGANIRDQIDRAFQLTLGRNPRPSEFEAASNSVASHGLPTLCRVLFNSNEFLFLP